MDLKNVGKFDHLKPDERFLDKNFNVNKQLIKKGKEQVKTSSTMKKDKIVQKLKIEREIVEQRIKELKEYLWP